MFAPTSRPGRTPPPITGRGHPPLSTRHTLPARPSRYPTLGATASTPRREDESLRRAAVRSPRVSVGGGSVGPSRGRSAEGSTSAGPMRGRPEVAVSPSKYAAVAQRRRALAAGSPSSYAQGSLTDPVTVSAPSRVARGNTSLASSAEAVEAPTSVSSPLPGRQLGSTSDNSTMDVAGQSARFIPVPVISIDLNKASTQTRSTVKPSPRTNGGPCSEGRSRPPSTAPTLQRSAGHGENQSAATDVRGRRERRGSSTERGPRLDSTGPRAKTSLPPRTPTRVSSATQQRTLQHRGTEKEESEKKQLQAVTENSSRCIDTGAHTQRSPEVEEPGRKQQQKVDATKRATLDADALALSKVHNLRVKQRRLAAVQIQRWYRRARWRRVILPRHLQKIIGLLHGCTRIQRAWRARKRDKTVLVPMCAAREDCPERLRSQSTFEPAASPMSRSSWELARAWWLGYKVRRTLQIRDVQLKVKLRHDIYVVIADTEEQLYCNSRASRRDLRPWLGVLYSEFARLQNEALEGFENGMFRKKLLWGCARSQCSWRGWPRDLRRFHRLELPGWVASKAKAPSDVIRKKVVQGYCSGSFNRESSPSYSEASLLCCVQFQPCSPPKSPDILHSARLLERGSSGTFSQSDETFPLSLRCRSRSPLREVIEDAKWLKTTGSNDISQHFLVSPAFDSSAGVLQDASAMSLPKNHFSPPPRGRTFAAAWEDEPEPNPPECYS